MQLPYNGILLKQIRALGQPVRWPIKTTIRRQMKTLIGSSQTNNVMESEGDENGLWSDVE